MAKTIVLVLVCIAIQQSGPNLATAQQIPAGSHAYRPLDSHHCPSWAEPSSANDSTRCSCNPKSIGDSKRNAIAQCDGDDLKLQACYCVSFYRDLNKTVLGNCLYACSLKHNHHITPQDPNPICNKYKRTGELCGKCKEGNGYPLYSYHLTCVSCTNHTSSANLAKYLAIAFLPLTVFYVIVVAFRVSATSGYLRGYVLMSQIITTPSLLRYVTSLNTKKQGHIASNVALSIHAIWNLDFFRSLYPPFCWKESTSTLFIVTLDYIIAFYPLCLIAITYILVHLHDHFYVIAYVWKPVHKVFSRIRRQWSVKRSLVDAFTTFILLSYIKILNASFDILMPTTLHNMTGQFVSRSYLYLDGSTQMFHGRHIKYACLAFAMTIVFNVVPLFLLLFYPCRCFQALLNRWRSPRIQVLHTFMDSFQGCYRTSKRMDCRYFAAFDLMIRILNLVIFSCTLSRFYYPFTSLMLVCLAALMALCRPYKSSQQNTIDTLLYLLYAFGYINASTYALSPEKFYDSTTVTLLGLATTLSIAYAIGLVMRQTLWKVLEPRVSLCCRQFYSKCCHGDEERWGSQEEELFNSVRLDGSGGGGKAEESTLLLSKSQRKTVSY